jgi:hypothetical protein
MRPPVEACNVEEELELSRSSELYPAPGLFFCLVVLRVVGDLKQ